MQFLHVLQYKLCYVHVTRTMFPRRGCNCSGQQRFIQKAITSTCSGCLISLLKVTCPMDKYRSIILWQRHLYENYSTYSRCFSLMCFVVKGCLTQLLAVLYCLILHKASWGKCQKNTTTLSFCQQHK